MCCPLACAVQYALWSYGTDENMNSHQNKRLIVEAGQANFESEVMLAKQPVMVAFCAPWSRPCHILDLTLDKVATACAGRVKLVKVNADDNPELSMWYEIQSVPTLLYFVDGCLRARLVGTASKRAIISKLQAVAHGDNATSFTSSRDQEHNL